VAQIKLERLSLTNSHYLLARQPAEVEPLMGLHYEGRLLTVATNIRLGCNGFRDKNTLAYFAAETKEKCFVAFKPRQCYAKLFTAVVNVVE
jgi:hypothetical protein